MSELNPYDKYLDGRGLDEILSSTVDALKRALAAIGAEKSQAAPAPGKWSPAEIVAHLADCEIAFSFRLRQTVAEDAPVMQPFDQEKWAETYGGVTAGEALEAFAAARAWNLLLLRKVLPAAADRVTTHPERGTMTFQTIVETMAGHDLNHLGQLQRLASA
jgi:hypothetical protein